MKHLFFAFLLFISGALRAQSGGMYMPTVSVLKNAQIYSVDSAHYMTAGGQCYVYGRIVVNKTDSAGEVILSITTPLPLLYNVHHVDAGNCFIFQPASGNQLIGSCRTNFLRKIQLSYTALNASLAYVNYFFIFSTN